MNRLRKDIHLSGLLRPLVSLICRNAKADYSKIFLLAIPYEGLYLYLGTLIPVKNVPQKYPRQLVVQPKNKCFCTAECEKRPTFI